MLLELRVKDLGIIEEIQWKPGDGLNVITGETGAGKSLVIDAVEVLLGGKVDDEAIRHGANEARIEGVFSLPRNNSAVRLKELLKEKGLQVDDDMLVIQCELRRQGRSVARVNGHAVPKGLLNQISRFLIDIHGQSEHLSLMDRKYHLDFLDAYAHALDLRTGFAAKAVELYKVEQEIKLRAEEEKDRSHREELLQFQLDEIGRAKLQVGEEDELNRERAILTSAEKLKGFSYEIREAIIGHDNVDVPASALDKLGEATGAMKKLVEFDPDLEQQLRVLEEASYNLEEVARDIRVYSDNLEYDPERLQEIQSRLELIENLKKKYGQSIADVLDYAEKVGIELEGISYSSERRAELEDMHSRLRREMGLIASELTKVRSEAAAKLVVEVRRELDELNMSQVEFEVSITQEQSEAGIPLPDGGVFAFCNEGVDIVEFMASTNPGEPVKQMAKIASTGEISRFTLALKGALSEADNIPVLIFDEIDIGVGGRSGEIIGKKLWALARNRQVICVTHLPQIAAFADAHYSVHKEVTGDRTLSMLRDLNNESRLKEVAVMLSGSQYTDTSLDNASELMQKAEEWKGEQQKGS